MAEVTCKEMVYKDTKIVTCYDFGKVTVELKDLDISSLLPTEVVVNVKFCGINFADVYMTKGMFGMTSPPFTVGLEASGKIVAIGSEKCGFRIDESVVVYMPFGGAFKEYLIVSTCNVYSLDKIGLLDLHLAASVFVNYLTAYEVLNCVDFRKIDPDDALLFIGCSGGVGLATADLLKNRCNILGVCSDRKVKSDELQKRFKRLFTYDTYDLHLGVENGETGTCNTLKSPKIIVDTMAGRHIQKCLNLLNSCGVYIIIGAASAFDENEKYSDGFELQTDLRILAHKGVSIHFVNLRTLVQQNRSYVGERVEELFKETKEGSIQPSIHATYKSNQIEKALDLLIERENIGKVILEM